MDQERFKQLQERTMRAAEGALRRDDRARMTPYERHMLDLQEEQTRAVQETARLQAEAAAGRQRETVGYEDRMRSLLENERTRGGKIDIYDKGYPIEFYTALSPEQKRVEEIRIMFHNAAVNKLVGAVGWTMDTLSQSEDMEKIDEVGTALLYRECAGFRQGLELYVQMTRNPDGFNLRRAGARPDAPAVNIQSAKQESEVELVRQFVRSRIAAELMGLGWSRENAAFQARRAESTAADALFIGGYWESEGNVGSGFFMNIPIRNAFRPRYAFANAALRKEEKWVTLGLIGTWATAQTDKSLKRWRRFGGETPKEFVERDIVPVPETRGNARKFWTIEKRGGRFVLLIPEGIPETTVESVWHRTKINKDRSLVDYLASGQEIRWNSSDVVGMWGGFTLNMKHAGNLWDYLRGKKKPEEIFEVPNLLGNMGKGTDWRLKRWIIYTYEGFDSQKRIPKLKMKGYAKMLLVRRYSRAKEKASGVVYIKQKNWLLRSLQPWDRILFPWDGYGPLTGVI